MRDAQTSACLSKRGGGGRRGTTPSACACPFWCGARPSGRARARVARRTRSASLNAGGRGSGSHGGGRGKVLLFWVLALSLSLCSGPARVRSLWKQQGSRYWLRERSFRWFLVCVRGVLPRGRRVLGQRTVVQRLLVASARARLRQQHPSNPESPARQSRAEFGPPTCSHCRLPLKKLCTCGRDGTTHDDDDDDSGAAALARGVSTSSHKIRQKRVLLPKLVGQSSVRGAARAPPQT